MNTRQNYIWIVAILIEFASFGQIQFEDFPNDRLIETPSDSIQKWLIGQWEFQEILDCREKSLNDSYFADGEYDQTLRIGSRNFSFESNFSYTFTSHQEPNSSQPPRGTWTYRHHSGEIECDPFTEHLHDREVLGKENANWFEEEGMLFPFRQYTFKIAQISPAQLLLVVNHIHSEDYIETFLFSYRKRK
jgi:hypothetical protein